MTLGARRAGDALCASAPDLARVWRAMREAARPDAFPGVLDGVIERFFAAAGEALAGGKDPALVWSSTEGPVRVDAVDPRRSRAELDAEWDLAQQVLLAACRTLDAEADASEWIARAVVIARSATRGLPRSRSRGILPVLFYSGLGTTRRVRAASPR